MRAALLAFAIETAVAWNCLGHMLVAQIGFDNLQPSTKTAIAPIVSEIASYYTRSPDFVTAGCWADDLKSYENTEAPLHYIDIPLVLNNVTGYPYELNVSSNPWAINQMVATLKSNSATALDAARAIRFLVHFTGDLHQPLHATSLFSDDFPPPEGDIGGNRYLISGVTAKNLHSLWDSGLGVWSANPARPLTPSGQQTIDDFVANITGSFPASSFGPQLDETDPFVWSQESYELAVSFVYTAPQSSEGDIPDSYLLAGYEIARSQVALAGYRLALQLDAIYA